MNKHLTKSITAILIILAVAFAYILVNKILRQITLSIVNSTMSFSGAKLMMEAKDIENEIPYTNYKSDTINGYRLDFEAEELSLIVFTSTLESPYLNKVVYIFTRNEEHEVLGVTKYSSDEEKKKALKKYGFKYNKKNGAYSKNGINIVLSSYIQIWIDNPDDMMSKW